MKTKKDLNSEEFKQYYIAPPVKAMLNSARDKVLKRDWDRVYLIDGGEGSGKSLLGLQLGYFLDRTLTLDRVTFTGKEFADALDKATKGQVVIFDEAFNGLGSSGATSKLNRLIVKKLMECRQKNLFIIIILPTIFLLQKYAALFRSQALFHVYVTKKGVRGYYRVYNQLNKKLLYLKGIKLYSYSQPYMKKSYTFRGKYPLNEEEYRKKKHEAFTRSVDEEKVDKYYHKFGLLAKMLKDNHKITFVDMSKYLGEHNEPLDATNISRLAAKITEKCEM